MDYLIEEAVESKGKFPVDLRGFWSPLGYTSFEKAIQDLVTFERGVDYEMRVAVTNNAGIVIDAWMTMRAFIRFLFFRPFTEDRKRLLATLTMKLAEKLYPSETNNPYRADTVPIYSFDECV